MKIYLLSNDRTMTNYWQVAFYDVPDIEIICDDFEHFMNKNKVDCIVSPANSYGIMDGGYDLAITRWFGYALMQKVQNYYCYTSFGWTFGCSASARSSCFNA